MRAIVWLVKFIKYRRSSVSELLCGYLSVFDLKESEEIILRQIQSEAFQEEKDALKKD